MSTQEQMRLAGSRLGRIRMHAIMLASDFRFAWHLRGIMREVLLRDKANPFAA